MRPRRIVKEVLPIAVVSAGMLVARTSLADHYVVPSGSMEPTVEIGDRILVDKRAFGVWVPVVDSYVLKAADPQPGDVVVLASPENGKTLLKRVVAGPGDVVAVRGGRVTRNGNEAPVTQEHEGNYEALGDTRHPLRLGGPDFGPARVPDGHYLVMGDNRGNSHDGRVFGFVARDAIRGRAVRVFLRNGSLTWRSL